MNLTVSAVIPVYNGEDFLQQAYDSIISQTKPVDEIVIIDDGSKDRTLEIARNLALKSKVPVKVFSQVNSGVSAARNMGVIKSSSDLIAFLDADDLWSADKLAKILELYRSKSNSNLMCFSDYYEDERQEHTRKSLGSKHLKVCLEESFSAKEFQLAFIAENFVGTASAMVFNRELALKINGFNISLNYSEDFDFIIRYSKFASVFCVPEPLVLKRNHGANLTRNRNLYLWSHKAALQLNILLSKEKYCRYQYSEEVVHAMKVSSDEFLIQLCNLYYEESKRIGLDKYLTSFKEIQSAIGLRKYLFAFLSKLIRTISFNLIKRY